MPDTLRFAADGLLGFAAAVLRATGVSQADAELTGRSLVAADRRGIHSHGLLRLPLYVEALRAGGINPRPELRWSAGQGATAVLDADAGLGQVAMDAAVRRAVQLAREHGVAAVAVQNSVHYGAGAYWTDQLAEEGMAAILTSTTGPNVAPFGGAGKVLGTNPLTIGVPSADQHPLTADLATSQGAYGKIVAARDEGNEIPAGWAVDAGGRPTVDAAAALDGALLPFAGAKGSAIAVLLEALSASLTTASFAYETTDIWVDPASRMNTGHLLIALDTTSFAGRPGTRERVAGLQARIRNSGTGGSTVHAPGDIEYARAAANQQAVPLTSATVRRLDELADSLQIPTFNGEPT